MTDKKRLLVYVAGPFSAPTEQGILVNLDRAILAANTVIARGHHPYLPHLTYYNAAHWSNPFGSGLAGQNDRRWIDVDAPWVLLCDAIYIMPTAYESKTVTENGATYTERVWKSRGAMHEYQEALKAGRKIFWSVEELPEAPPWEGQH